MRVELGASDALFEIPIATMNFLNVAFVVSESLSLCFLIINAPHWQRYIRLNESHRVSLACPLT